MSPLMLQWQSSERCDFDLISKLNLRPALAVSSCCCCSSLSDRSLKPPFKNWLAQWHVKWLKQQCVGDGIHQKRAHLLNVARHSGLHCANAFDKDWIVNGALSSKQMGDLRRAPLDNVPCKQSLRCPFSTWRSCTCEKVCKYEWEGALGISKGILLFVFNWINLLSTFESALNKNELFKC